MNKTLVILNPAARSDKAARFQKQIRDLSPDFVLHTTSESGEARRVAAQGVREGYETIVAAGGDGTINEVVNGLGGSTVRLGILPVGTVNVLAKEIGVPQGNLREAWQIIEQGKTIALDLPMANGQYFIQLAGVGLHPPAGPQLAGAPAPPRLRRPALRPARPRPDRLGLVMK